MVYVTNMADEEISPINQEIWEKLLKSNAKLNYFFDITVKSAAIRKKAVPATILICPEENIRDLFLQELSKQLQTKNIRIFSPDDIELSTDYMNILAEMKAEEILCLTDYSKKFENKGEINALYKTKRAAEHIVDFRLGKGRESRIIHLDLPEFSFVICVKKPSDITHGLKESISNIIDLSTLGKAEENYKKYKIKNLLETDNITISEDAVSQILELNSSGNYRLEDCIIMIRDYTVAKLKRSAIDTEAINEALRETEFLRQDA